MQTSCMSAPIVAAPRRRVSRSARWLLVVIGVLFGVALINWVAISVHISNLRHEAAVSTNEDEVLGLRADAQEFQSAQSLFEGLTVTSGVGFVGFGARAIRQRATPP